MTFHWHPRQRRAAIGQPLFDDAVMLLEDRIMLDAVPVVSVTPPDHVFLNNPAGNFQVTLTFDNHSGSQAGYGPYIEVVVPKNGADGVANGPAHADGATFVSATYLGQSVAVAANVTFDAAGHATNPLSGDVVNGTPGDGLVVLQLPFGSVTPPQTTTAIIATFSQSPLGDVGTPLTIAARGGFQYGLDPLDNPLTDPHIVGAVASASYSPTLAVLTKTSDAPTNVDEETATGPNNDHFYTLSLDVANGQTLTDATLSDALPDSVVYLGATVTSGTGTITHQPTIGAVVDPADNLLTVNFGALTGGPGTNDAVVKVHFYVNDVHTDGTPVINPTTGAIVTTVNTTQLTSTYTPIDPIDPVAAFVLDATHPDTIHDKPIAIQKSATIVTDTGPTGLNSGDTIEYKLTLQVSDYFTLGNLSLTDVLSDGQRLDTGFAPTIQVTERGIATATTPIAGVAVNPLPATGDTTTGHEFTGNFASSFNAVTGTTTSTIDLSNVVPGGILAGGRTLPGDDAGVGGTTVTITFRAVVQNNFESNAIDPTHNAVHQGDTVGNTVTAAASIRDNLMPATVLGATALRDDGAASLTIARGGVTKSIYAINGDTNLAHFTSGGQLQLVAGDLLTYRLTYDLPITSYQALSLTDFLPLPVLTAQSLTFTGAALPAAGAFAYGPTDTLHLEVNAPTPTETFDPAGNSVRFGYADYSLQNQGVANKDSKIDLLFTVAVQDSPLADGLFLTNLATSSESNTPGNATSGNSIVRFTLTQPRLLVQKAIVTGTSGTITTPETVAGLTFLPPGTTSAGRGYVVSPATQQITDATLGSTVNTAAPRLNSNITGLDGGDNARVALVVNNQGTGVNGAYNVVLNDALVPGTSFLGGSLASANLIVTRGDGTIFTAGTDYAVTSTATGFSLQFLDGATGKIERNGAADHGDIVLVTYDIHLDDAIVIAPKPLTSSATISSFAAIGGGINQVKTVPTDAATITLLQPVAVKTLVSTTDASTTGGNLTIGEQATYSVTYTLSEGTTPQVRLADILPANAVSGRYQFVSASIVSVGANLKQADGVTAADAAYFGSAAISSRAGIDTTATFGGATGKTIVDVADNVVSAADQIVVNYVVRPANVAANVSGLSGVNTGQLTYGTNTRVSATAPIGITLPDLTVVKTFLPNGNPTPDAGDPVAFSVTVANPGTVTGYALDLADPLPAGLAGVTITGVTGAGLTAADFSTAGDTLTLLNHLNLASGQSFTVTFAATLTGGVNPGGTLTNTATLDFATADGGAGPVRTVVKTGDASVTVAPDTITKTIFTTSLGNDASPNVAIGELISYNLTANIVEGTSPDLTVGDALPPGLALVSSQVIAVGANLSGATLASPAVLPGGAAFGFGDVTDLADNLPQTAADQIVVRVVARVVDIPSNVSHTVLTDVATVATVANGTLIVQASAVPVTVTVPDLIIAKTVSGGTPDAGDAVTFTINVRHAADSTATAYDLALTDALPAGLTNLQLTAVNNDPTGTGAHGLALTPANFTTAGNRLALTAPVDLALDQSFTVTITAVVADATVVGSHITNAASLAYSTLPGVDPGERSFAGGASASLTTAASQTFAKAILATDDPVTGTAAYRPGVTDLAIGETATVQLTTTLEQGTTLGVVIVDHLPVNVGPAGTSATFGFVGTPLLTPGAGITFTGSGVGVLSDTNGDGIADTVTYTLGSVTVPGTPGAGTGTIIVTYGTTPLDRPENQAGDALASPATLTSALGGLAASVDYDLVAPNLTLVKAVAIPAAGADAGDPVRYTVTLANTGTGPAADIMLADIAAPGIGPAGPATLTVGGTATVFASPAAVVVPVLAPGQTATIVYSATVTDAAMTGGPETNTATATYDSHAGPGGRPGTANGSATFTTNAAQAFTKTIVATSVPSTGSAAFRPGATDLVIGEQATFELVATLSEGTTTGVVVTDHLPVAAPGDTSTAGTLAFAGTPTVTIGGTTVALRPDQIVTSDTNGDGIADTIRFNLGSVTIPGSNNPANDTIRIRYDVVAPDLAVNAAGDMLTSPATFASSLGTLAAAVDVDLVQPALTIAASASVATVKPGDLVTYTVVVANPPGGSAQAEDVVGGDLLAGGQLVLVPGSVTTSQGAVAAGNGAADTTVAVQVGALPVGAPPVTITFQAHVGAAAGSTVDTVANVTYDGIPGSIAGQPGRSASATADAMVGVVGFTKAITGTSLAETGSAQFRPGAPDLAIDETATFTLTVTLPAGTTPVALTDLLGNANGHLELVGTPTVAVSPSVTVGPLVTTRPDLNGDGFADLGFTLGSATAPAGGGTVTITYTARVSDIAGNVAGGALDLPATFTFGSGTLSDSRAVDLVAPLVTLAKTDTVVGVPNAGDTISYAVTATNSGSGPAYDLTLSDVLPGGEQIVAGSARLTVAGTTSNPTSPLSLAIPLLDAGQTAVLRYDVHVGDSTVTGTTLTNTASVLFDSLAGPGGRTGAATASAAVTTEAVQALTKTIVATSEPFTGSAQFRPDAPDLTIGEVATIELRATLSEGTTNNVVLTDTLQVPGGTLVVTGTPTIVFGNGTTAPFAGTITTVDTNGDGIPDQVRFVLGNVTIPGDNDPTNNTVAIRYQAVVADRPENHAGDALVLPATLSTAIGTSTAVAAVDLVAPMLAVTKVLAPDQPADGQSTVFILTVGHTANSSAAATGVVLTEVLPAGSLLAGETIVSGPAGATVAGGTVTVPLLGIGDTLVARVAVIADPAHPAAGDTVNRVTITYGTIAGGGGHLGQGAASAVVPLTTVVSTIRLHADDLVIGPGEDRRYVSPLLPIEPVYSGAAAPGSFVEIVVTDEFGGISGEGGALTDAGGNWLIRLPSTSVDLLLHNSTLSDYYASTRLFSPPDASLFATRDLFGYARPNGVIDVGSVPAFGTQVVHINVTDSDAGFTALYAPTWRDQVFVEAPGLNIPRAFSDAAGGSIRRLYDELAAPEAAGLNRFNHAFLSAADL